MIFRNASLFAVLVFCITMSALAQTSSPVPARQQGRDTAQTSSPSKDEAQKHYKAASVAMKDGDFDAALKELTEAVQLDPANGFLWYNLAVVQSIKGMAPAALDSLEQAMKSALPTNLRASAEDLKTKLTAEQDKRKQNPKIVLAQQLRVWSGPEYAAGLAAQRNLFLTTIGDLLGPERTVSYAGEGGELVEYYHNFTESSAVKNCENRVHADLDAQHPDWKNATYDRSHRLAAGPARESQFSSYDEFVAFASAQKCQDSINEMNTAEIAKILRDLDDDLLIYVTSNYRWTWKPGAQFPDIDENWVDVKLELITAEGQYSSSSVAVDVGHGFAGTELLGKNPPLMFSRVAQNARDPLVQLIQSAGFK